MRSTTIMDKESCKVICTVPLLDTQNVLSIRYKELLVLIPVRVPGSSDGKPRGRNPTLHKMTTTKLK